MENRPSSWLSTTIRAALRHGPSDASSTTTTSRYPAAGYPSDLPGGAAGGLVGPDGARPAAGGGRCVRPATAAGENSTQFVDVRVAPDAGTGVPSSVTVSSGGVTAAATGERGVSAEGGRVRWAGPCFSAAGRPDAPAARVRGPGMAAYRTAPAVDTRVAELPGYPAYQAFAEVTDLVREHGAGRWWAADAPARFDALAREGDPGLHGDRVTVDGAAAAPSDGYGTPENALARPGGGGRPARLRHRRGPIRLRSRSGNGYPNPLRTGRRDGGRRSSHRPRAYLRSGFVPLFFRPAGAGESPWALPFSAFP